MVFVNNNENLNSDFLLFDGKIESLADSIDKIDESQILLLNPDKDILQKAILAGKDCHIIKEYIADKDINLLNDEHIKKIFILEDSEATMLESRLIDKYILVKPATFEAAITTNERYYDMSSFSAINNLNLSKIHRMVSLSAALGCNFYFFGPKHITCKNDFDNLIKLTYSKAELRSFPPFDLIGKIEESRFIFDNSESRFPIVAYRAIEFGNIPLLLGNRYRRWILDDLQNPDAEFILNLHTNDNLYRETVEKQKELFDVYFKNHKRIEDVI